MTYRRKLKPISSDFTVVYDHREEGNGKKPWVLPDIKMERTTLKTGDYSIVGYESKVALEHKSGIPELYKDLVVSYRPTFERFLQRMSDMQYKAIIVEEELTAARVRKVVRQLQYSSNGRSCLTEETAWFWIGKIQAVYGVPIVFCGKHCVKPLAVQWLRQTYQQVRR